MPATNSLNRQLNMLPGHQSTAPHVPIDDLVVGSSSRTGATGAPLPDPRGPVEDEAARAAAAARKASEAEDAKKKAAAAKAKVGSKAAWLTEYHADGKHLLLGPKSQGDNREILSKPEFEKLAPKGACMEVWCASHPHPWVLCSKKGAAGHTTQTGGAHAVRSNFRQQNLAKLFVVRPLPRRRVHALGSRDVL